MGLLSSLSWIVEEFRGSICANLPRSYSKLTMKVLLAAVVVVISCAVVSGNTMQCYSCTDCAEDLSDAQTVDCNGGTCTKVHNLDGTTLRGCEQSTCLPINDGHYGLFCCSDNLCNGSTDHKVAAIALIGCAVLASLMKYLI